MKTTSIISTLAIAAATLAVTAPSCSKKDNPAPEIQAPEDEGTPLPAPSTEAFTQLQEEALEKRTTLKKIDKTEYTKTYINGEIYYTNFGFLSDKNTGISCNPNYFEKQDGTPYIGDFDMSFAEIHDRGDMLLTNRPLMGKNADGKLVPLVSGGQFFADVKQGGETLNYANTYYILPEGYSPVSKMEYDATTGKYVYPMDDKMKPWKGSTGNDGNVSWGVMHGFDPNERASSAGLYQAQNFQNGQYVPVDNYDFQLWEIRNWVAIGRFYVHNGASTKIKVKVPDGYNAQNAKVYLAYEGEQHLLAQLYSYDAAGKHFTEPDGFVPVGKAVHAIFVSESGGKFAYGIKTVTVKADEEITFAHKDLAVIEPDALAKKVNDLK